MLCNGAPITGLGLLFKPLELLGELLEIGATGFGVVNVIIATVPAGELNFVGLSLNLEGLLVREREGLTPPFGEEIAP